MALEYPHQPVLVNETVGYLVHAPDGIYVDGTAGSGGHSLVIGNSLSAKGRLICLDLDPEAVRLSRQRLGFLGDRVQVVRANYADLNRVLEDLGIAQVDGILLDLGMSSYQLDGSLRGFSFSRDEPIDMRMDPDNKITAGHLVNNLPQIELANILKDYGEEKRAKAIARAIVRARNKKPIETSSRLSALIKSVFPAAQRFKGRHPAARSFQALRIAVNKELKNLDIFLDKAPLLMAKGARLVILSYHSLEDRRVKKAMAGWENTCTCPPDFPYCVCNKPTVFSRLFRKVMKSSPGEIAQNPRARSARLRVAERS